MLRLSTKNTAAACNKFSNRLTYLGALKSTTMSLSKLTRKLLLTENLSLKFHISNMMLEDVDASDDAQDFCQTCMSTDENNLKDMIKKHYHNGRYEVYSEMLDYCFCMQLGNSLGDKSEDVYFICEACIKKLRDVVKFKSQVETAQQEVKHQYRSSKSSRNMSIGLDSCDDDGLKTVFKEEQHVDSDYKMDTSSSGDSDFMEDLPPISGDTQKNKHSQSKRNSPSAKSTNGDFKLKERLSPPVPINYHNEKPSSSRPSLLQQPPPPVPVQRVCIPIEYSKIDPSKCNQSRGSTPSVEKKNVGYNFKKTSTPPVLIKLSNQNPHLLKTNQLKKSNLPGANSSSALHKYPDEPRRRRKFDNDLPYKLEIGQLKCELCEVTFETYRRLQQHMPSHFPNYTCEICGKPFANYKKFYLHRGAHSSTTYSCDLCTGKGFKTKAYLRVHMKVKHGDKIFKPYKCPTCDKRFDDYQQRQNHLVVAHGQAPQRFKCHLCTRVYSRSSRRSQHIRITHLNERNIVCEVCSMRFFSKFSLRNHMLTHYGERNFECTVCGKKYLRQFTLTEHMKIHTGEKRYVCEICSKAFTQKCSLKGHMATHHRNASNEESSTLE